MPVKSRRDEEKWERAKEIAEEAGMEDNWAYVMGIYRRMKPDYFKPTNKSPKFRGSIQALMFRRDDFTTREAKSWARDHGFRAYKTDITANYIRLRQRDPEDYVKSKFRTITLDDGVKAVYGSLKARRNPGMPLPIDVTGYVFEVEENPRAPRVPRRTRRRGDDPDVRKLAMKCHWSMGRYDKSTGRALTPDSTVILKGKGYLRLHFTLHPFDGPYPLAKRRKLEAAGFKLTPAPGKRGEWKAVKDYPYTNATKRFIMSKFDAYLKVVGGQDHRFIEGLPKVGTKQGLPVYAIATGS